MASRPGRKAAAAAQARLEAQANERQVISDSDGGSAEEDGEDGEESSSESEAEAAQPELSAYEMQRMQNIAKNEVRAASPRQRRKHAMHAINAMKNIISPGLTLLQAVLASLGLAGTARPNQKSRGIVGASAAGGAASNPRNTASSSSATASCPAGPPTARSGGAGKRRRSESEGEPAGQASPPSSTVTTSTVSATALAGLDVEEGDADAYFALLCGSGYAPGALLGIDAVRQALRDLGLDTDGTFSEEKIELMIDMFDQGGKGALSLHDFRALMQQAIRPYAGSRQRT